MSLNYTTGRIYKLETNTIFLDPNQPRKYFDENSLDELTNSIKKQGLLQPVLFRVDNDKIMLVAGERRLQAAKKVGLKKVPAIMVGGDATEISLIENIMREDLTPIETAEALFGLKEAKDYTNDQLTEIIGKAKSTISEILTLMNLPKDIRDKCKGDRKWSATRLLEIAKTKDEKRMRALFERAEKEGLTGEHLRKLTRGEYGKRRPTVTIHFDRLKDSFDRIARLDPEQVDEEDKKQALEAADSLIEWANRIKEKFGAPN